MNIKNTEPMTETERLEQAADWFDLIDEMNEKERQAFSQWMADTNNQRAFERMSHAMGQPELSEAALNITKNSSQAGPVTKHNVAPVKPASKRFSFTQLSLASAAAMLIVALLIGVTFETQDQHPQIVAEQGKTNTGVSNRYNRHLNTAIAEESSAFLEDGSVVFLSGNTVMSVDQSDTYRHVNLQQGQAYFDVAKDVSRPFLVQVENVQVEVVGTEFDIDRIDDKTEIRVYEGVVTVHADKQLTLEKGDGIVLRNGLWETSFAMQNNQLPGWRTGWLEVTKEPVKDIISRINRYVEKPIRLEGNTNLPVSGRFNLKNPQQALQLLTEMDYITLTEREAYYLVSITD